jgi:hypothetical protein
MTFRIKLLIAFGIFLLLSVVLAATFPARVLTGWLSRQDPNLAFAQVEGTVWRGSAAQLRVRGIALGRLQWRVSPLSLFRLAPAGELQLRDSKLSLDSAVERLRDGSIRLTDLQGTLDASWLAPVLAIPALVPTGKVQADFSTLQVSPYGLPQRVQGELRWEDAGVFGLVQAQLGGLRIRVDSEPQLSGLIESMGANPPVEIHGVFALKGLQYSADVMLTPNTSNKQVLRALEYIGQPSVEPGSAAGARHLKIEGKILLAGAP